MRTISVTTLRSLDSTPGVYEVGRHYEEDDDVLKPVVEHFTGKLNRMERLNEGYVGPIMYAAWRP